MSQDDSGCGERCCRPEPSGHFLGQSSTPGKQKPRYVSKGLATESNGQVNVLLHRHIEPDVESS